MARTTLKQDLLKLRKLKREAEEAGRKKKAADAEFKRWQMRCLERLEAEEIESLKSGGTLFSPVTTVKATIEDRAAFVRWALDNEPELVQYKERGELLNALVRERLDNGQPMPPGVNSRPDAYISQRSS